MRRRYNLEHKSRWNLNIQMLFGLSLVMLVTLSLAYQINNNYISDLLKEKHQQTTLGKMGQANDKFRLIKQNIDSVLNYLVNETAAVKLSKVSNPEPSMDFNEYINYYTLLEDMQVLKHDNDYLFSLYLITGNNYMLGINEKSRLAKNTGTLPIQQTEYFKALVARPYQTLWESNIPESAFTDMAIDNLSNVNTVTVGKCAKIINGKSTVTALLNIDSSSLLQLYEPLLVGDTDTVFIVNAKNVILSSNNKEYIGKICRYNQQDMTEGSGQFASSEYGETMQVVYYKIEDPDWYIIMQTPDNAYKTEIFELQRSSMLTFITCYLFTLFLVMLWIKNATRPLAILCVKMDEVGKGNFGVQIGIHPKNEFGNAINNFNIMSTNLARLNEENKTIEQQRREQELKALRTQINPHFIYNTLNMIKWMAVMQKADNIADCIITLADILKPVFKTSNEQVALADEVEYLRNYIKILNYRLENTITCSICYDEKYSSITIPRFTLQPLIENSVQHGHYKEGQQILISIDICEEDDDLIISIIDNGQGMPDKKIKEVTDSLMGISKKDEYETEEKVGIYNVNKRIKLHYGNKYGLFITSTGRQGTVMSIRIPNKKEETTATAENNQQNDRV